MSGKTKKIITICTIVLILAGSAALYIYTNRTIYNAADATGNTTGNLNNNGMFCEYNGRIYFSNPYDHYSLYSMNPDCSDIKQLNVDSVSSINVHGNYIYYIRNNSSSENAGLIFRGQLLGVIRTNLNGENPLALYDSSAGVITLYGNDIYYQRYAKGENLTFHKVSITGENDTRINNAGIYPASIYNGNLYYVNTDGNHCIYTYNFANGLSQMYLEANAYMVDMQGDYIYYIDLNEKYSLVRVNTTTQERTVLVDGHNGRCTNYNIYGNSLFYYVEGDTPALYRMNVDGSDNQLLKNGYITNINCTSQYTFFQIYGIDSLYRIPTSGGTTVELVNIQ